MRRLVIDAQPLFDEGVKPTVPHQRKLVCTGSIDLPGFAPANHLVSRSDEPTFRGDGGMTDRGQSRNHDGLR
jgi:hypothetical protein